MGQRCPPGTGCDPAGPPGLEVSPGARLAPRDSPGLSGFPGLLTSCGTRGAPQGRVTSWVSQGHPQDRRGLPMPLGSQDTRGVPQETCHVPGDPQGDPLLKSSTPICNPLPPAVGAKRAPMGAGGIHSPPEWIRSRHRSSSAGQASGPPTPSAPASPSAPGPATRRTSPRCCRYGRCVPPSSAPLG